MRIDTIGKHKIELFNSIDELPVERYVTYNRMLLIDSGLGADFPAIDGHITKALHYIMQDQKEEARQELVNMRNSFYFITENMNPKHLAYAALVHSVDGKQITDFSDEALEDLIKTFSRWGATKGFIENAIDVVKKKLPTSWRTSSLRFFRVRSRRKPTDT